MAYSSTASSARWRALFRAADERRQAAGLSALNDGLPVPGMPLDHTFADRLQARIVALCGAYCDLAAMQRIAQERLDRGDDSMVGYDYFSVHASPPIPAAPGECSSDAALLAFMASAESALADLTHIFIGHHPSHVWTATCTGYDSSARILRGDLMPWEDWCDYAGSRTINPFKPEIQIEITSPGWSYTYASAYAAAFALPFKGSILAAGGRDGIVFLDLGHESPITDLGTGLRPFVWAEVASSGEPGFATWPSSGFSMPFPADDDPDWHPADDEHLMTPWFAYQPAFTSVETLTSMESSSP